MSWKNIKTFMIILLLMACASVGTMLWLGGDQKPYTQESFDKAAALMKEGGITIDSSLLDGDFEGMKLYRFTLPANYPENVAKKLTLGTVTDVFTVPHGVEMRTDKGESLFVGNDFSIRYSCSSSDGVISESDLESLLMPLCQSPEFGVRRTETNGTESTFVQTLNNIPIPANTIKCIFKDNKLAEFNGKWCFPDKCSTFSAQLRDYLNIMFTERERVGSESPHMSGEKNLTVETLQKCYGIESGEGKSVFVFVPSLQIVYREGQEAIHSAVPK